MKLLLSLTLFFSIVVESIAQVPLNWTRDEINPGEDFTLFQDNSVFTEGEKSLHMQLNKGSVPYLVSDIFYISPGADYTFSVDVLDNDTAGQVKIYADFYDAYGFDIFGEPPVFSADSADWVTISWQGTVPSQAVVGYILIKFYNQPDLYTFTKQANIWLDNVQFIQNDGPDLVANGGFEEWVVGMEEDPEGSDLTVFPNPADDYISLKSREEIIRVELYNSAGQRVRLQEANGTVAGIPVAGLMEGLYLLKIETGIGVVVKKLIIHH